MPVGLKASVTVVALTAEARMTVDDAKVKLKHHLWIDWSWIATDQIRLAGDARARALILADAGQNWASEAAGEARASMIAISACAHAIDAIYGGLKSAVGVQKPGVGASRHAYIRTAVVSAYRGGNGLYKQLKDDFAWLFELRDSAVHPDAELSPAVPHPVAGDGSREAAWYCLENARRASRVLLELLALVADPTSARSDEARAYGDGVRGGLEALLPVLRLAAYGPVMPGQAVAVQQGSTAAALASDGSSRPSSAV